jgi:hypothetical protein
MNGTLDWRFLEGRRRAVDRDHRLVDHRGLGGPLDERQALAQLLAANSFRIFDTPRLGPFPLSQYTRRRPEHGEVALAALARGLAEEGEMPARRVKSADSTPRVSARKDA